MDSGVICPVWAVKSHLFGGVAINSQGWF